ncbi:hypothetical protein NM688_g2689 [Phlebia brevispora]|uniref:Uncharacterized protein n=1 Tax=Phlebia brevispora TaxID=194682 RepID=A0ACC1T842_9APHY|nr:hypothetical protein NM688_g2689 [Phlebia brevispora]
MEGLPANRVRSTADQSDIVMFTNHDKHGILGGLHLPEQYCYCFSDCNAPTVPPCTDSDRISGSEFGYTSNVIGVLTTLQAAFLDHAGKGRSDFRTISIHFSIPRILLLWTLVASTVQTLLPFLGGMHTCILFAAIASVICVYQVSVASSRLIHDMWTYVHRVGRRKSQTADEAV